MILLTCNFQGYPTFMSDKMAILHRHVSGEENVEVKNPFESYTFPIRTSKEPDLTLDVSDPSINPYTYLKGQHTVRYPIGDSTFVETQTSNYTAANEKIHEIIETCVQPRVFSLMKSEPSTYQCFVNNNVACTPNEREIALDRIHSYAHEMMAGDPHVGHPYIGTVANTPPFGNVIQAFDPNFHILHAGMDYYHALWQRLNPDIQMEEQLGASGVYTRLSGEVVDFDSDLTPFWKNGRYSNEYLNSHDVWDHRNLGYDYELLDDYKTKEDLLNAIDFLYGKSGNDLSGCQYDLVQLYA